MKKTINLITLFFKFPDFSFISKGSELCGYNKKNNECIIIDDGMCTSHNGSWYIHHYKVNEDYDFNSCCKYPDGEKLSEKWVHLT